jgi:hypothetical protein
VRHREIEGDYHATQFEITATVGQRPGFAKRHACASQLARKAGTYLAQKDYSRKTAPHSHRL